MPSSCWCTVRDARSASLQAMMTAGAGCSGCAAASALAPCVSVQVAPSICRSCVCACLTARQQYLTLNSALDTSAALAIAWASAIAACDSSAAADLGCEGSGQLEAVADGLRPSAGRVVLLLPDVDILCPGSAGDDALALAAAFMAGSESARKKGVGVVATAMDQLNVSSSISKQQQQQAAAARRRRSHGCSSSLTSCAGCRICPSALRLCHRRLSAAARAGTSGHL